MVPGMSTWFDIVTVVCFLALVAAFFLLTGRETQTLMRFGLSGIVLAVANQVGNAGSSLFAALLIVAGIGYAVVTTWRSAS